MAIDNVAGLARADLGLLATSHARQEAPCGPTRPDGEPDHYVEQCSCGVTTGATGDPHTFVWADHMREYIRESLNLTRADLVRRLEREPDDDGIDGYRKRILDEVNWIFAEMGGDSHESRA